jgi:hypothetical protein
MGWMRADKQERTASTYSLGHRGNGLPSGTNSTYYGVRIQQHQFPQGKGPPGPKCVGYYCLLE